MLETFHPAVAGWFGSTFSAPTRAQELAWPAIASGEHALLVAPTGSGKTLAAFLALIDRLAREPAKNKGVRLLYVSPLKALNHDVQRNLDAPLAGIVRTAAELGVALPTIRAAVRTGDTLANERHRMTRTPPDILITTPESLYLILTSPRAREILRTVQWAIVDEIHAVAGTKRGSHLALSLERLERLAARRVQRIGLSATQRPLDEIARFLGGTDREVRVLDAGTARAMDLVVESPVTDWDALGGERSAWDEIEPRVVELIRQHRTTLVFVNARRGAERLCARINELAEEPLARAHHGSMSREERLAIEGALKAGELRAIVATASLELGIDIGSIDCVVQVESPKGIARGLQRVGRSGHLVGQTSRGRIIPKFRGDLVECAAVARGMREADVEPTRIVRNALDVLAQQIVAMSAVDEWQADDLFACVRRAHPYRDLSRAHFDGVLAMLAGKYPSEEFGDLRPRIVWDRTNGVVRSRPGSSSLALISGGTIPDRGQYPVVHATRETKLGELDEEMVNETRAGDVFVLGARTWKITEITPNRVFVTEAEGAQPTLPFWKGDAVGRDYGLGVRVGRMLGEASARLDDPAAEGWLRDAHALDRPAATALMDFLREQATAAALPSDRRVVIETYRDEIGDRRVIVHAPFGRPVLQPWTHALVEAICRDGACGDTSVTDDGILIRFPEQDRRPPLDLLRRVTRANVDDLLLANLSRSRLFATRFRENAQRALLLPRRGPGRRTPLWLNRLRAADLLEVARKFDDFPIVHETVREILENWFDLPHLREVLAGIEEGTIEVVLRETETPSPFAASLGMLFVSDFIEEGDRQQPEFREIALSLDRSLLRDLLGTTSLRGLLDHGAIAEVVARLQRTDPKWRARDRDEVEDLLVRLGPLSDDEVAARTDGDAAGFLRTLEREGRARLLPSGTWGAVEEVTDRGALLRRHLRTRGPVPLEDMKARFGERITEALADLERDGSVVVGEFTPGREGLEAVDARVLAEIHRATLAKLRREIEPRDAPTYARFLLRWHGVAQRDREVAEVLDQLQGVWLPIEVWECDVLPARVSGYHTSQLDATCASGEFAWVARRSAEGAKPRIAFFRRADLPLLAPEPTPIEGAAAEVLAALRARGAVFAADLAVALGRGAAEVQAALWELVFAGFVTNDSFDPLRNAPREIVSPWSGGLGDPSADLAGADDRSRLTARDAARAAKHRAIRTSRAAAGRWSALPRADAPPDEHARAEAWARVLLDRHGVVGYEQYEGEETGVDWSAISAVLRRWEMRGDVRRGEFVAGHAGAQFALPSAVERLRDPGDEGLVRLVSAMDPASQYGAALPSPGEGFARAAGAHVVLDGGRCVLRAEAGGKRLVPVGDGDRLAIALAALPTLLRIPAPYRGRRLEVRTVGDEPAATSDARPALAAAGFEPSGDAMVLWASRARGGD